MTKLLIADPSKAGLVMSTEVFKEKIPGIEIIVAQNGKEFLGLLPTVKPDIGIVDFDLPDVDGTTLIRYAKDIFDGPILLTAYLDDSIREVINSELFAFEDAGNCIEKPVRSEKLAQVIDRFLVDRKRVLKRFEATGKVGLLGDDQETLGKMQGVLVNISLGGACLEYSPIEDTPSLGQEVTLTLYLSNDSVEKDSSSTKFKGILRWIDRENRKIGIKFSHLSDQQRQVLENSLRYSAGLDKS